MPVVLAYDLEVTVEPKDTAIILLNPRPIGDCEDVHGRTVAIDVLPQPELSRSSNAAANDRIHRQRVDAGA